MGGDCNGYQLFIGLACGRGGFSHMVLSRVSSHWVVGVDTHCGSLDASCVFLFFPVGIEAFGDFVGFVCCLFCVLCFSPLPHVF